MFECAQSPTCALVNEHTLEHAAHVVLAKRTLPPLPHQALPQAGRRRRNLGGRTNLVDGLL